MVLIDEYDAPIQSKIDDGARAEENRKILHDFHSALKTLADRDQLHFLFVTGVTKFAQASVFNNLNDLTKNPEFNDVYGFTKNEWTDHSWT